MKPTLLTSLLFCAALSGAALPGPAGPGAAGDVVAVKAGTIHTVEGGRVLQGATILIEDGRIKAIGKDVEVPTGARVVDYGEHAVITPGFVSANSNYGQPQPSPRTADPTLLAADNFDPYAKYTSALKAGVTSTYLVPARGRLVAGQGAAVKLHGEADGSRVLNGSAAIHGAIDDSARNTPGFWEPPVPATVDVGLGVEQPQLPRSTMGAVVALRELLAIARGESDSDEYGPGVSALRGLIASEKPWRMLANSENEIRALLGFFAETGLPLVIEGGRDAGALAGEIKAAGASVIVEPIYQPDSGGRDFGKGEDSEWPRYDVAAQLVEAGVPVAIATPGTLPVSSLRFAASIASRGGLDAAKALEAITLAPARVMGIADRVGSLKVGKDADLVVLTGAPMELSSSVTATWVGGEVAWKASETGAVVLHVDELHLGDGHVLTPGEVLMQNGKILEVGTAVARPPGSTFVRGAAAMPGMIDALGHLGLEGSRKVPNIRFDMARLAEPGDFADRRVAQAGVTTVLLAPRGTSPQGTRMMAYRPAAEDVDGMVISDPTALRVEWQNRNRLKAGEAVKDVLEKAKKYKEEWAEYESKIATWKPPAPEPEAEEDADSEDGDGDEEEEDDEDDKKKRKKKDEPAKPVTGVWHAQLDGGKLKLRLLDEDGELSGSLRCASLAADLVEIHGKREDKKVTLSGTATEGELSIEAESDNEGKLKGKAKLGDTELEFEAEQVSTEYLVASRPEVRKEQSEPEPKGKPKSPGIDPNLEPLRQAMLGNGAVVVNVERRDEILDCVNTFESYGIRPILYGAEDAWRIADKISGRVAGILLSHRVLYTQRTDDGNIVKNRYAELQASGIPVAFHSAAEEGAADLPLMAAYAVSQGMSPQGALSALTGDAARMFHIHDRVGVLASGRDADVVLLDGSPLDASSSVVRVWVRGWEVR